MQKKDFRAHKKRTNTNDDPCISKIELVTPIFVGQGTIKLCHLKSFKSQCLSEFFRYGPDFLHVIITFIDLQITISKMGFYSTPSFISEVVSKCIKFP